MSITIRDDATAKEMNAAERAQDIHAADGRLLGRFIPARVAGVSCPELGLTDEELRQRSKDAETNWRTPEEVMARLREIDRCSH